LRFLGKGKEVLQWVAFTIRVGLWNSISMTSLNPMDTVFSAMLEKVTGRINEALSKRISFSQRDALTQEDFFLHPNNLELKNFPGVK
jgi:hypothetical protein